MITIFRLTLPALLLVALAGCSAIQKMRGLPPREEEKKEAAEPVKQQKLQLDEEKSPAKPGALKTDADFEFDNGSDKQREDLLARKKKDVFSLKGEDKPIRSIRGSNSVESEEINKIYDDLDKGRNSGSVFKFY